MTDNRVLSDEQIEKGRKDTFSTDNPFCPCDSKTMSKAARWAEQAVLQSSQVQQWRKDADLWKALIGCARIRPLGSAGLKQPEKDENFAHLGLELWSKFGRDYSADMLSVLDSENETGKEWLIKFSEIAARAAMEKNT